MAGLSDDGSKVGYGRVVGMESGSDLVLPLILPLPPLYVVGMGLSRPKSLLPLLFIDIGPRIPLFLIDFPLWA